jgi:hypothetical protein
MSSDDDMNDYYIDALGSLTPLPPGSTGTPPGYVAQTTPAPQLSQQRAMPSTTRTDFATSGYRQRAPSVGAPVRRNLSGQINHAASGQVQLIDPNVATRREDNLVRIDAQGRLIDSRGQRVSPSVVINMPPKRQQVETLEDLIQRDHRAVMNYLVKPSFSVARGAVKHVVVPAAKMAGKAFVEAVKANKTHMRFDPALTGNPVPSARAVTPLVRALARTASGVLASASERSWSNKLGDASSPAIVIDATKQTGDDMPPPSDIRPDIARRELVAMYERYAPEKLDKPDFVDSLLRKWEGRHGELLRMVRLKYESTVSTAVSAPDSPGATPNRVTSADIEDPVRQQLAFTDSAPTPRSSTPPPASPEPATSQSNVVRSTQRNGHSLVTVDSNASFQSTVSHGLQTPGRGLAGLRASSRPVADIVPQTPGRGLAGLRASSRPAADIVPQTPGRGLAGLRASSSAVTDVGDPSEGEPTVFNPRQRVNTTVSAPFGLTTESQIQAALQRTVSVKRQEVEATLEDTQTAAAAATVQNTQVSAVAGMNAVAAAARAAQGASPETLVSLLEELQRNPQLRQLASAGLLSWNDLLSDRHETLPDGTKVRVVDAKKLLALQQRLSTLAQKEAGKLQNIQQVAVQNRTVPGFKQATPGAIYPGVSVFMYPREMPAGRPGA